ncbi:hypothetical protein TGAM01_v200633 [Trichoderma gamsii]|uniref:Uncharacterized protein n=1 Tax=Trichoderma gamsii TaxID=398673 RepID=A0A2P5A0Z6_9HYPO|nr:hypothetical protein TGAM01_v200633 [Trichoderma gamsii]PON30193.1 hypothetical protein TGAM01_v200633 [Trichoderma gamsii]
MMLDIYYKAWTLKNSLQSLPGSWPRLEEMVKSKMIISGGTRISQAATSEFLKAHSHMTRSHNTQL